MSRRGNEKEIGVNTRPIPDVYVLWHPSNKIGDTLARRIYKWLRPRYGLGPQVFYRSAPAPGSGKTGLPLPLPGEVTRGATPKVSTSPSSPVNMQIVIL